jgi:hypothetical protein
MKRLIGVALAVLFTGCSDTSSAQQNPKSPEQIGESGARAWASFECAAIASFADDVKATQRHFEAGHQRGLEFLKLAKAAPDDQRKKITDKVPVIMLWRLEGPSPDFMLGRVWEATTEYVDDELEGRDTWSHQRKEGSDAPVDKEVKKMRAENRYRERNCNLLDG